MKRLESWLASANEPDAPFPLNNLPCGVFSPDADRSVPERDNRRSTEGWDVAPRCGVAIGDRIFDCRSAERAGLLRLADRPLFEAPVWNELMAAGPRVWAALRKRLTSLFDRNAHTSRAAVDAHLFDATDCRLHLPFRVAEFTDFYASRHHATNVGTMMRGADEALPPAWLHMPIGYNGRASSVVVSGTPIRRPWGQLKSAEHAVPGFLPSRRFDFELELGAIVGTASDGPVTVDDADAMIFGYVLLNDWSARDIQAWEYRPLGPFQAKATATTIGSWIVMAAALAPFRVATPERAVDLLPHLADTRPMAHDIELRVELAPAGRRATCVTRTNARELYYSAAQQLAHHASSGCPMRTGDLLGSGTVSGATRGARGSLLELSWGGREPLVLDTDETRRFLEDGDHVTLGGCAVGDGYTIGFGECHGRVLPALADPLARR